MTSDEIKQLYDSLTKIPAAAANEVVAPLASQQEAQGSRAAAMSNSNLGGTNQYVTDRLIMPTVNELTHNLIVQGKQAALNAATQEQLNAARSRYNNARSRYASRFYSSGGYGGGSYGSAGNTNSAAAGSLPYASNVNTGGGQNNAPRYTADSINQMRAKDSDLRPMWGKNGKIMYSDTSPGQGWTQIASGIDPNTGDPSEESGNKNILGTIFSTMTGVFR